MQNHLVHPYILYEFLIYEKIIERYNRCVILYNLSRVSTFVVYFERKKIRKVGEPMLGHIKWPILRIPPLYAFWPQHIRKYFFGHFGANRTYHGHFRWLWRHRKKFSKKLNLRISVSERFVKLQNMVKAISSTWASKWYITWPVLQFDFKNRNLTYFSGILSELPI